MRQRYLRRTLLRDQAILVPLLVPLQAPLHHMVLRVRMLLPRNSTPCRPGILKWPIRRQRGTLLPWRSHHRGPRRPLHRRASMSGSRALSATTRSDILPQVHTVRERIYLLKRSICNSCCAPIRTDGPVLEPMLVKAVGTVPKINPLLLPLGDGDNDERPHLQWNMLFATAHCRRSTDPSHRSWSNGRQEPATFPRVSEIRIISRVFPWIVNVHASNRAIGVTCGDLIEQLSDHLQRRLRKEDYEGATGIRRRAIRDAYHHNRSRSSGVPGGQLGDGLKALDWLGPQTMFGGIQQNEQLLLERFNVVLPCVLELVCVDRPLVGDDESEERRHRRRRSGHMSTSRPSSRVDDYASSSSRESR